QMRFKNRYLSFQMITDPKHARTIHEFLTPSHIATALKASLQTLFGDMGMGLTAALSVKYYSPMTGVGIVRVQRDMCKQVWAALTMLTEVQGVKCLLSVFHVSGTIKQAQISTIQHDKDLLLKLK
ncbi:hypothetical protein BC830DRAFT_1041895, partial [Chytriomyces sp. MP71]